MTNGANIHLFLNNEGKIKTIWFQENEKFVEKYWKSITVLYE